MSVDRKFQIFISSTFEDLKVERRAVMEEILNLGHIPVGMELFQAGDDSQWSYIKRRISGCDYYVIILAERYGSVGAEGKSYTQLEYEYAVESGIPVISFLLSKEARERWPQNNIEFNRRSELDRFREICQQKIVRYWHNTDDLRARMLTSLVELIREKPRAGWVRSDTMASSEALSEIAQLSSERRGLQLEVAKLIEKQKDKPSSDIIEAARYLQGFKLESFVEKADLVVPEDENLLKLLVAIAREIAIPRQLYEIQRSISKHYGGSEVNYHKIEIRGIMSEYSLRGLVSTRNTVEYIMQTPRNVLEYELTEFGKLLVRNAQQAAV